MTNLRNVIIKSVALIFLGFTMAGVASCSKSESYSELLREEEKAVNLYLSQQTIAHDIPADSISFETGENAPFYRLDPDGYVYMQVIRKGETDTKIENGDIVYFRFNRKNLKDVANGIESGTIGNSDNLGIGSMDVGNTYFIYENNYLTSTTQWGTGIQMPMKFFGYGCEVNLVLRSYYGFSADQTYCIPYLVNVRYFKPEY